jgi:hypothetical protein
MQIINKIEREKGFNYRIDKNGNIIKEKYNIFKDPYTLVTIAILVLGGMYYMQMKQSITNTNNFDEACSLYIGIRNDYVTSHPFKEVTYKEVIDYWTTKNQSLFNFGGNSNG